MGHTGTATLHIMSVWPNQQAADVDSEESGDNKEEAMATMLP